MRIRTFCLSPLALSAVVLILSSTVLSAQSTLILAGQPDTEKFPIVSAYFHAYGEDSNQIKNLSIDDLAVLENQAPREVLDVTCPPEVPPKRLSSVLALDVSGSMLNPLGGAQTLSRLHLVQEGAKTWINELDLPNSECAITTFHRLSELVLDFSRDRSQLNRAIDGITADGGTDYNQAFVGNPAGGITIAARGEYKRVLILLTDGQSDGDEALILDKALDADVQVYCIAVSLYAPPILQNIADSTGGLWFENVTTVEQIRSIYRMILQHAQGAEPCKVTWLSAEDCSATRQVSIGIPARGAWAFTNMDIPGLDRVFAEPSVPFLSFGSVAPGDTKTLSFTVTARDTLIIDDLTFNGPEFSIDEVADDPLFLPYTLVPEEPLRLTVRYTPNVGTTVYRRLTISTTSCSKSAVSCTGGFDPAAPRDTIEIVHPNGGEEFIVGIDTVIRWTGVLPSDPVRLEYSYDEGRTWTLIAPRASGLEYDWQVPNTPSRKCLARVIQLNPDRADVSLSHDEKLIDARLVQGRAYTLDAMGTVRIWDGYSGTLLQQRGGNGFANQLEVSPNGKYIAVAESIGGVVIIYDTGDPTDSVVLYSSYLSGITQNPYIKGLVAFSADNSSLLVSHMESFGSRSSNVLHLYDPETGAFQREVQTQYQFRCAAYGPDNAASFVAAGGLNGFVQVWGSDFQLRWNLRVPNGQDVVRVAFSKDGTQLMALAESKTGGSIVALWDLLVGQLVSVRQYEQPVHDIDLGETPEGIVALLVEDYPIFRLQPSNEVDRELIGHVGVVRSGRFNENRRRVITTGDDRTARIWDIDVKFPRSDVSDTLWAIVAPDLKSYDVDFGTVPTGWTRDSLLTEYLVNKSPIPISVEKLEIVGIDRGDFYLVSGGAPFVLQPDERRDIEVEFSPNREGDFRATVQITTNAGILEQKLLGKSRRPALEIVGLLGDLIDFGKVPLGQSRDSVAWAVNTSSSPVEVQELLAAGPDDVQFELPGTDPDLPVFLDPDDSVQIRVRFTPQRLGLAQGGGEVHFNGEGSPVKVRLFGEGIGTSDPVIEGPSSLVFNKQECEASADTLSVEIHNPGTARLEVTSAEFAGPHPSDFRLAVPFVAFGLEPDGRTTLDVIAEPTGIGERNATMILKSNAVNASEFRIDLEVTLGTSELGFVQTNFDAGLLCPGETKEFRVALKNSGTLPTVGETFYVFKDQGSPGELDVAETRFDLDAGAETEMAFTITASGGSGKGRGRIGLIDSTCSGTLEVLLEWEVVELALSLDTVPEVCAGDPVQLNARGADYYEWEYAEELSCLDCPDPTLIAETSRTYIVHGYNEQGCRVSDSVHVSVRESAQELKVRIGRQYRTTPGDSATIVVELVDQLPDWNSIEDIELRIGYDPNVLVVYEESVQEGLAGTLLDGWNVIESTDHTSGELVVRLKSAGMNLPALSGDLLRFVCRPFFANVAGTDLTVSAHTTTSCIGFAGEDGYIRVDSLCGLDFRLFELGFGKYSLGEGMQNPVVEGMAAIPFSVGLDGETSLEIFDSQGNRTGILLVGRLEAGTYEAQWDVSAIPSGVYYCRLTSGDWQETKALVVRP